MFTLLPKSYFSVDYFLHFRVWVSSRFSYSKVGYAGNSEPQSIFPSCIAVKEYCKVGTREVRRLGIGLDDLNFYIGDDALALDGKNDFSVKVNHPILRYVYSVCLSTGFRHNQDFFSCYLVDGSPLLIA